MSTPSPDLEARLRTTLHEWAAEAPTGADSWSRLLARAERRAGGPIRHLGNWVRPQLLLPLAIAAAIVATIVVPRVLDDPEEGVAVTDGRASTIDRIELGSPGVRSLAVHGDRLFLTSERDERLYELDPATATVIAEWPIPEHVEGVISGGDDTLWLSRYDPDEALRFDLRSGTVTARLGFGTQPFLLVSFGSLWAADETPDGPVLHRIDPETVQEIDTFPLPRPPGFLAAGDDVLWMASLDFDPAVIRIDPEEDGDVAEVQGIAQLDGATRGIAVAPDGLVWATIGSRVASIDPDRAEVLGSVEVSRAPFGLAADEGGLWVTNFYDGTLSRVTGPATAPAVTTYVAGNRPGAVVVDGASVWVSLNQAATVLRIGRQAALAPAASPDLEQVVETPGGRVYIRCSGEAVAGRPTAVLEADLGWGVASMVAVESALAPHGRVCATDRAFAGPDADTGVPARPAGELAEDLRLVLAAAGEAGPFVVVGDGWGAVIAQFLAHRHPGDVAGLVLVSPLPATFYDEVRSLLSPEELAALDAALREGAEHSAIPSSMRELQDLGPLADLPMTVIAFDPRLDGRPAAERPAGGAVDDLLGRLYEQLAFSSSEGEMTVASGARNVVATAPDAVVEAVDRVLSRAGSS